MIRHLMLRYLAKRSWYVESGTGSSDSDDEQDNETTVSVANNGCQSNRPATTAV